MESGYNDIVGGVKTMRGKFFQSGEDETWLLTNVLERGRCPHS